MRTRSLSPRVESPAPEGQPQAVRVNGDMATCEFEDHRLMAESVIPSTDYLVRRPLGVRVIRQRPLDQHNVSTGGRAARALARDRTRRGSLCWDRINREPPAGSGIPLVYERRMVPDEAEETENPNNLRRRMNRRPPKRTSWNRSLSTRGRESIVFAGFVDLRTKPSQRGVPKKTKQNEVHELLHDFSKEKAYFEEVDAFELLEESPSPARFTWKMGADNECVDHDLAAILERWKKSKLVSGCSTTLPLSMIMETIPFYSGTTTSNEVSRPLSQIREKMISDQNSCSSQESTLKPSEQHLLSEGASNFAFSQRNLCSRTVNKNLIGDFSADSVFSSFSALRIKDVVNVECEDAVIFSGSSTFKEAEVGISTSSLPKSSNEESQSAFGQLLMVCRQKAPMKLFEVFSKYCDAENILKLGEGTYGEAFRAGENVCKVVPIDGDLLVNGEPQKKSEEMLEEVLLSLTLNSLREQHGYCESKNATTSFIEVKDFRVCQGSYCASLIRAWEEWDAKNNSENDHPKAFVEEQCYIVFVLADGGRDLENFVLQDFNEARSVLVQAREAILFLNLSADPELFRGPKGDVQFETYRKMKEVTGECWEEKWYDQVPFSHDTLRSKLLLTFSSILWIWHPKMAIVEEVYLSLSVKGHIYYAKKDTYHRRSANDLIAFRDIVGD
ncbi:hypothetical protein AXF42_Ash013082 [Apostasia shenzhenica]|uniref:non-specific serine/threonine protein kinase n=1 Tax=Apostasia shenzhenica TaxID=1088818 RepID=A0A2I0BCY8_9ASPA|nr:hypothetical protein AXF42_Ash013082 [Apostasia shenzhenica]